MVTDANTDSVNVIKLEIRKMVLDRINSEWPMM